MSRLSQLMDESVAGYNKSCGQIQKTEGEGAQIMAECQRIGVVLHEHGTQISGQREENVTALNTLWDHMKVLKEAVDNLGVTQGNQIREMQSAMGQVMQGQAIGGGSSTGRDSPNPLTDEQFARVTQRMGETEGSLRDLCRDVGTHIQNSQGTQLSVDLLGQQMGEFGGNLQQLGERLEAINGEAMHLRADVNALHINQDQMREELIAMRVDILAIHHHREGDMTAAEGVERRVRKVMIGVQQMIDNLRII